MVANKWLAGVGTRALSLNMLVEGDANTEEKFWCEGLDAEALCAKKSRLEEGRVEEGQGKGSLVEEARAFEPCVKGVWLEEEQGKEVRSFDPCVEEPRVERAYEELRGTSKTLVCIDTATLGSPKVLSMPTSSCLELPFVKLQSSAHQARRSFSDLNIDCALVYSSNEIPALNVAAALKQDFPHKKVFLVAGDETAWLAYRMSAARLDGRINPAQFYKELLKRHIKAPDFFTEREKESDAKQEESSDETLGRQLDEVSRGASHEQSGEKLRGALREVPEKQLNKVPCEASQEMPRQAPHETPGDGASHETPGEKSQGVPYESPRGASREASESVLISSKFEKNLLPNPIDTVPLDVYAADALVADSFEEDLLEEAFCPEITTLPPRRETVVRSAEPHAFYVPVVGACGGVGKSAVAFLSALCSARFGCKTLLIDFDMQFGDMALFSQDEQVISLDELLADPQRIRHVNGGPEGFALVAACALPEQSEAVVERLGEVFDAAAAHFDVIVSNGPAFWNDQHMALLERAGKILFVVDQRLGSVKAAQRAFDLCMRCGLASSPFLFLLNKCGKQAQLTSLDVTCAIQGAPCKELPDGGRLISEYLEAKQAMELLEEGNCFAEAIRDLMMDILPGCNVLKGLKQPHRSPFSFFSRKRRKEDQSCL